MNTAALKRFNARHRVDMDGGCWIWMGATIRTGYGIMWDGRKNTLVHRLSYEHFVEPIEGENQVHHLCGNTLCCNPEHLEQTTRWDNNKRGKSAAAKNARKTHCPQGHEYDKVKKDGTRVCSICRRERRRRRRAK